MACTWFCPEVKIGVLYFFSHDWISFPSPL